MVDAGVAGRRVLIAFVLALLAGGGSAGVAGAASPSAPDTQAMGAGSQGGAQERLRALARVQRIARTRWRLSFAGMWVDEGNRVTVAFAHSHRSRVRELRRRVRGEPPLRAVRRPIPLSHLRHGLTRMVADRERVRRGALTLRGVPGAAYDLHVDVRRNAVVVTMENATAEARDAFRRRYGRSGVIVRSGSLLQPDACTREQCAPDLRAGLSTTTTDGRCTTAFTARMRSGRFGVYSAGHCSEGLFELRRHHRNGMLDTYGSVQKSVVLGRLDAEWHWVNRAGFSAENNCVFMTAQHPCGRVEDVGKHADLYVGHGLCMSGITSGERCGKVLSLDVSPSYVPWSQGFIAASYCAADGDSGAPVYYSYRQRTSPSIRRARAHGIHSGSTKGCGPDDQSIFSHIAFAEAEFGANVLDF